MPRVRIFLLTYRRPHLLRRALASLLRQTCTDWICEVHNDAPDDEAPRHLVAELGDPRIEVRQHAENWGPVTSMRHAFAGGSEPLAALLEDDNWWEPDFVAEATRALAENPDAALAWSNMRLWREESDGSWTNLQQTIWETTEHGAPLEFCWPQILQAFDALHSNGAMVFRPSRFVPVPAETPFDIIEPVRERAASGTLLLLPQPLANFAITRGTARQRDPGLWLQSKLLIAASFFSRVEIAPVVLARTWAARRELRPRDTAIFFFVALALRKPALLRSATLADWLHFVASVARHPAIAWRGLRFRREQALLWKWLLAHPASSERRGCGPVLVKRLPTETTACPVAS